MLLAQFTGTAAAVSILQCFMAAFVEQLDPPPDGLGVPPDKSRYVVRTFAQRYQVDCPKALGGPGVLRFPP
jgi:hypothetical protein